MIQFWYWKKNGEKKGFLDMTHMLIWSVYNMKADFRWFFFFFRFGQRKNEDVRFWGYGEERKFRKIE